MYATENATVHNLKTLEQNMANDKKVGTLTFSKLIC